MEKQVKFSPVAKQDDISVGKLDGEAWSGAYLSSEFLDRLAEVHSAAQTRLATLTETDVPDAVRNLLGIVTRLLAAYATAVQPEREAHRKEAWDALMRAKSILDDMRQR
jgi:hypothetical protein